MKIIFMGTPDFAVPSLRVLLGNSYTVSAVVTAPDKPKGRGLQRSSSPVKECALEHSLPVLQPESLKDPAFIDALRGYQPDLFVIVAFRILPKEVYTIPPKGAFNLHASLLPKYRGAAPINWAIINGETESGVTTFFLRDTVDTGNIILQRRVPVPSGMNAGELHDVLSAVGSEAVLETVRTIDSGNVAAYRQDDTLASPAPKIFKETCRIDWHRSSEQVRNFIRGISPYPGAWSVLDGKTIKIYQAVRTDRELKKAGSGTLSAAGGKHLFVRADDGWLEITELQQEGKKRMSAQEFMRGFRFAENTSFR